MSIAAEIQKRLEPLFPGLMGVEIKEATQDKIVASMLVRPDLCTAGGVCHGGAFMAFADTIGAVGTVVNLPPNTRTTTIESKTNFMGAAPVNSRVIAESIPLHRGKHHAGVADDHQDRGRQALRRCHANTDGAARGLSTESVAARALRYVIGRVPSLSSGVHRKPKSGHNSGHYDPGPGGRKRVASSIGAGRRLLARAAGRFVLPHGWRGSRATQAGKETDIERCLRSWRPPRPAAFPSWSFFYRRTRSLNSS